MPGLVVKPRARIFHGHDWVYASEIKKSFGNPSPGDVISLKDFKDRPLGSAIYNPASQIVARRFSRRKQVLDRDFFGRRIERALKYRQGLSRIDQELCRIAWSESDGLPGVVIDRYGEHVVLQTLTLGMNQRIDMISEAISETFSPKGIILRNDSPMRAAEGLSPETRLIAGEAPSQQHLDINGISFTTDLMGGQKTGLYLDQLSNYRLVAEYASGQRVLDCFTNQGGFALHCAAAGAGQVIGVDSSGPAISSAKQNAQRSGLDAIQWMEANVFDDLKKRESGAEEFDLIILDPPSFTRNKRSLKDALRGYKEIHLRALKMLNPGGILVTFTCSHHVSRKAFLEMVRDAAVDAKRTLRQSQTFAQRADHPINPSIPETEYLHGFAFEILPAW
ncbi:MAG: class I SAM-dependent rRNA methyltransferase [Verrucomicrobiales bacterium]|nr:class I SAM-dependent rRNA methyltransferase [Verrucomicrobiales bacterium]